MCGIFFRLSTEFDAPFEDDVKNLLLHRGPDAQGSYRDQAGPYTISFVHTRLSILDVSPSGHQPMRYHQYVIIFNGEIYNYIELRRELEQQGYAFKTQTDTEVIAAMYDRYSTACFSQFIGMWALVIYDTAKKEIVISRDRFGIKPLYFSEAGGLTLSSEIKPIIRFLTQPSLNRTVTDDFLTHGLIDHGEDTIFDGVKRFPSACYAVLDLNKRHQSLTASVIKYYAIEDSVDRRMRTTEELEALLTDAVQKHLRSDVPLGFCLSGGLDSSTLLKLSTQTARLLDAVAFHGYAELPGCDERDNIALLKETTPFAVHFTSPSAEQVSEDLPAIIRGQEEPFLSTSIILQWYVFKLIADHGVKVVLDGQGADEIFAGYPTFYLPAILDNLKRYHYIKMARLFWRVLRYYPHLVKAKIQSYRALPKVVDANPQESHLKTMLLHYIKHRSLPSLLRYEDKNSMYFSVESRVPYLDHRLVDFAMSCDPAQLINGGSTKHILRETLRKSLPREIINEKRKIGFASPESRWLAHLLRDHRKEFLRGLDLLADEGLGSIEQIDEIRRIYGIAGTISDTHLFWRYFCLIKWRKSFNL